MNPHSDAMVEAIQKQPDLSAAAPQAAPVMFAVKFKAADRNTQLPNTFLFHGQGEMQLHADKITTIGSQRRLFHSAPPERFTFYISKVFNVLVEGAIVRFDIDDGDETTLPHTPSVLKVACIARSNEDAALIATMLPTTQTGEFIRDFAEKLDFFNRLDHLGNRSPVTMALVALNVLVFLGMVVNGYGLISVKPQMAIDWGSNFGPVTMHGQWWRLGTCTFIHFGLIHLALNMLALYATGRFVERIFGSWHFLLLYLFAGLTGSMASIWWHPLTNSAGASGAIFGVFGALLVFMLNKKNAVPASIMQEHGKSTGLFIVYNLVNGFAHAGIDNSAHMGGLLGGMAIGWALARPLQVEARTKLLTGRFLATCAAAAAILVTVGYAVLHPSAHARQETDFVAVELSLRDEAKAIDEIRSIQTRFQNKQINVEQFANELDNKVIPRYLAFLNNVSAVQLDSDSKYRPMQLALIDYFSAKLASFQLASQALRTNDGSLTAQIQEHNRSAEQAQAQIKKLNEQ